VYLYILRGQRLLLSLTYLCIGPQRVTTYWARMGDFYWIIHPFWIMKSTYDVYRWLSSRFNGSTTSISLTQQVFCFSINLGVILITNVAMWWYQRYYTRNCDIKIKAPTTRNTKNNLDRIFSRLWHRTAKFLDRYVDIWFGVIAYSLIIPSQRSCGGILFSFRSFVRQSVLPFTQKVKVFWHV